MTAVRPPVASGSFYPAAARELARIVDALLAEARPSFPPGDLRALLVPHAGYVYSGAVAASAFAVIPAQPPVLRVSLLGPSHYVPVAGVAVSDAGWWSTPLGDIAVDEELRAVAVAAGAVIDPAPHRLDHALEVELPFLQRRMPDALTVLPAAVGDRSTDTSESIVSALAASSLIVVSSDLSHYLDDDTARARDRRTARAVVDLDEAQVHDRDACGAAALRALLACARRNGWTCSLLDLRTSADACGDTRRVVGYGAFAFTST